MLQTSPPYTASTEPLANKHRSIAPQPVCRTARAAQAMLPVVSIIFRRLSSSRKQLYSATCYVLGFHIGLFQGGSRASLTHSRTHTHKTRRYHFCCCWFRLFHSVAYSFEGAHYCTVVRPAPWRYWSDPRHLHIWPNIVSKRVVTECGNATYTPGVYLSQHRTADSRCYDRMRYSQRLL